MQTKILLTIGTCVICASAVLGTDSSVPHIKADQVHALGFDGSGVTVAVIDTGIDYGHPGLDGHIRPGGRSYEGGDLQGDPGDDVYEDGHGTYMSLIIADASGVAPGADILPIRVFGPLGAAVQDVILGIEYVTHRQEADPSIRVINLSLGGGQYPCQCDNDDDATRKYQAAISTALNAGILTFAATGNYADCGWIGRPACVSAANKVAASYDRGYPTAYFDYCSDVQPIAYRITCFSHIADDCNYFLAAPGFDISVGGFGGDGTSQATAHASGVAAMMYSKLGCGSLGGAVARDTMFNTADEYWWQYPYCALPPPPRHINALDAVNAVSTGASSVPGDMDCDGTVSLYDLKDFVACMAGPDGGPVLGFCASGDFPTSPPDGDIDLRDFAGFQRAFTGFGSGACCHANGTCTVEEVSSCIAESGATYRGHGTTCGQVACPLPDHGACCQVSGTSCSEQTHVNCGFGGGLYMGDGTMCSSTPCPVVRYRNVINPLESYAARGSALALADDITLAGAGGGKMVYYDLNVFGGTGGGGFFSVTVGLYNNFSGSVGSLIAGTQRTFTNLSDNGSPVFISATFEPPVTVPHQFWMVAQFSNPSAGWFIASAAEVGFTEDYFGRNVPPWGLYWYGGNPYAGFWANVAVTEAAGAAGAVFELVPDQAGPYSPGQTVGVEIWMHNEGSFDIDLWMVILDFKGLRQPLYAGDPIPIAWGGGASNNARWNGTTGSPVGAGFDDIVRDLPVHETIGEPNLIIEGFFQFDFSSLTDGGGEYEVSPGLPGPRLVYTGLEPIQGSILHVPAGGSLRLGDMEVVTPGTAGVYKLVVAGPSGPGVGSILSFGFGGPGDPITAWLADSGDITGEPILFTVQSSIPGNIPTVSHWGVVVMALLLTTGASLLLSRHRWRPESPLESAGLRLPPGRAGR